jgi:hypothetical protein
MSILRTVRAPIRVCLCQPPRGQAPGQSPCTACTDTYADYLRKEAATDCEREPEIDSKRVSNGSTDTRSIVTVSIDGCPQRLDSRKSRKGASAEMRLRSLQLSAIDGEIQVLSVGGVRFVVRFRPHGTFKGLYYVSVANHAPSGGHRRSAGNVSWRVK